jgi:hypothetical protein
VKKKTFKYYRVSCANGDGHQGYTYCASKREAEAAAKNFLANQEKVNVHNNVEIKEIEIEPTKRGILNALLVHAGHPDNG